jgi:hypothetical protein
VHGISSKKGRSSFLKKRSKKLLFVQVRVEPAVPGGGEGERSKVFWFFFSKKNILPSLVCSA